MPIEVLRETGKRRIAVDRVLQLLEGPLTTYVVGLALIALIAGGRSTYWDIAIHVGIHTLGAHPPQGDVR